MIKSETPEGLTILTQQDYKTITAEDFGMSGGLSATEIIGPFVPVKAAGPLIMVHDGLIEPHMGIGHHPHRYNERLFYILEGALSHDDSLNGITGEMPTGGLARLTEGRRGMLHKEWNHTDVRTRAFILVYGTDPMPATASIAVLADTDAPRYEAAPGVTTKELVGPRANFPVCGDIRLYTDNSFDPGGQLDLALGPNEGALQLKQEGQVEVGGRTLSEPNAAMIPPAQGSRTHTIHATEPARLLLVVHGPGRRPALEGGT